MADDDDMEEEEGGGLIGLDMAQLGSGSMSDPLRHAMGMRNAQDQREMRTWSSFPQPLHGEQDAEIETLRRSGEAAARLARARQLKDQGNAALKAAPGLAGALAAARAAEPPAQEHALRQRIEQAEAAVLAKGRELKALRQELAGLRKELDGELRPAGSGPRRPSAAGALGAGADGSLRGAITSYEKAAGLLRYVECVRLDWKNEVGSYKGIEDDNLRLDAAALEGDGPEAQEARDLVASCYLNIALAAQRLEDWDLMTKACDEVLTHVNPSSVKALYRRAQAAVSPVVALDADADRLRAIQDLHTAAQLEPNNKDVRALLGKLRAERVVPSTASSTEGRWSRTTAARQKSCLQGHRRAGTRGTGTSGARRCRPCWIPARTSLRTAS